MNIRGARPTTLRPTDAFGYDVLLWKQMVRLPGVAGRLAAIADALMQPERPIAPEFDCQRLHAEARPKGRARHGRERVFRGIMRHFLFQGEAPRQRARLARS